MKNNLTNGNVWKTLFVFALPFLLSYFLQTLYGMADLYIIGQFNGTESTTAIAIGSQVMHMLTVMIVGLAMGTVVTIGQATGGNHQELASQYIGNTITLFLTLSFILTIGLLLLVKPIVALVYTPTAAIQETIIYLSICFGGIPLITAYNILASIYRGLGDSKRPMYFIALACFVNIALDYLLIGGLRFGAAGAALATVIAQGLSVGIALVDLHFKKNKLSLKPSDFKIAKPIIQDILKIGIPVAVQDGFIQVAFILITVFANQRGLDDAAAVGIVEKIICILFLVPSSLLQSVSALAALNLGAGKPKRARLVLHHACVVAIVWGLFVALFMQGYSENILSLFSKSEHVVVLGNQYMKGYVWDCMLAGIHFSYSGYFCACGVSMLSFIHNALSIIAVRIPCSYYAAHAFPNTLLPMGLAAPAGSAFSVIICIIMDHWLKKHQTKTLIKAK